jgi:hypothetical protein
MQEALDKPTVEETYSRSVTSSNLRMETREDSQTSAADVLIAAGWSSSRLGAALMRLRAEYDGLGISPTSGDVGLLQMGLKSLPFVHEQVGALANRWNVEHPGEVATAAVAWWLSHVCRVCNGRRFQSIAGTPALSGRACNACRGTGETNLRHGHTGRRLVNFMDDCVSRAQQSIKNRLRR